MLLGPCEVELLRWKRLEKAAEVTEGRRWREASWGGLPSLSLDMVGNGDVAVIGEAGEGNVVVGRRGVGVVAVESKWY